MGRSQRKRLPSCEMYTRNFVALHTCLGCPALLRVLTNTRAPVPITQALKKAEEARNQMTESTTGILKQLQVTGAQHRYLTGGGGVSQQRTGGVVAAHRHGQRS